VRPTVAMMERKPRKIIHALRNAMSPSGKSEYAIAQRKSRRSIHSWLLHARGAGNIVADGIALVRLPSL
jgi:hypothetical protein